MPNQNIKVSAQKIGNFIRPFEIEETSTWPSNKIYTLLGGDNGYIKDRPVEMAADPDHFRAVEAKMHTAGSGYQDGDAITIVASGTTIALTITDYANHTIVVADPTIIYDFDPSNRDTDGNPTIYTTSGGHGTGLTITINSVYAPGDNIVIGTLEYVENTDPLVQISAVTLAIRNAINNTDEWQWPLDTEQDLGNGVYGMRKQGTITIGGNAQHEIQIQSGVDEIREAKGNITNYTGILIPINTTLNASTATQFTSLLQRTATTPFQLSLFSLDNGGQRSAAPYHFFVKYTKRS